MQHAVLVHAYDHRRDLEQRVALDVEAAGFDIDDDRKEAAETLGDARLGDVVHRASIASEVARPHA